MSGKGVRANALDRVIATTVCLATLLLAVGLASVTAAPSRGDGNDSKGPLDLARVRLVQHKRTVLLALRLHGSRPSLRGLTRFPSRVGADDQRYLCLQLHGRRIGRRLLCPGGKGRGHTARVGVSSYGRKGAARKRGHIRARVKRDGKTALELRFSLSDFEPGRLHWAVLSGWTGAACTASAPRVRDRGRERRGRSGPLGRAANLCLDRAPNSGFYPGRIFKLKRVGCTRASPLVHRSGSTSGKRIALTFDDGPSEFTERVVGILDHHGAKGTFFDVGSEVPGKAAAMRKALRHGHELANHSLHHESFPGYSSMRETNARIEAATGFEPCAFRPPGGAFNSGVVSAAARNGMSTVIWDVDPRDWSRPGTSAIYSRVVGAAHPGAIVVMHDGGGDRSQTVAALPRIIETLKGRGYDLVTVTQILGERFIFKEDR